MNGIGVLILVAIYFAPTMIAMHRDRQTGSVFVLNLFLGWTLIGWVAALVIALWTSDSKSALNA